MSPVPPSRPGPLPAELAAYLRQACLAPMWAAATAKLERAGLQVSGTLTLNLDEAGAQHLAGLLRAPVRARPDGTFRLPLARLDDALRASMGARGLLSVLAELRGAPLTDRRAAASAAGAARADLLVSLEEQLNAAGLSGAGWVGPWLAGVRATGQLTRAGAGAPAAIKRTVAVVRALAAAQPLADADTSTLRSSAPVPATFELAELATRCCGGAHGLDPGEAATGLVLRALAPRTGKTSQPVRPADASFGSEPAWRPTPCQEPCCCGGSVRPAPGRGRP